MDIFQFYSSFYFLITLFEWSYANEGRLSEYCQAENFNPTCAEGEVINMRKAQYGHIKLGRCVDQDFGHLGCYVDQLAVLDNKCSGRRSCDLTISDTTLGGDFPCTLSKALIRYLEASFICLKVYSQTDCLLEVLVTSRTNYLSSETTKQPGCGEETKPWQLQAKEGQRINITFIDFNWKFKSRNDAPENCPVRYGYIVDVKTNDIVNLCGGLVRERNLYTSKGNHVQVLIHRNVLDGVNFLVGFKALGCPTYKSSSDTWIEEHDDYISVGCVASNDQWKMRCIGNHWLGPLKDCSQYLSRNREMKSAHSTVEENEFLDMPPAVAFSLLGGIFLVLCSIVVTVVVGIVCIRKNNRKSKKNLYAGQMDMNPPILMPMDHFATYKSVQVKLPKKKDASSAVCENPFGSIGTLPSLGSMPRHPPGRRESPHYYLLEGREPTETEPLYDVVYQGLPTENNV